MTPPEKIYLQVDPENEGSMGREGVTWCADKINETDVEYVRKDLVREIPNKANE